MPFSILNKYVFDFTVLSPVLLKTYPFAAVFLSERRQTNYIHSFIVLFAMAVFFIFPATNKMLSKIRLRLSGANKIFILNTYETTIAAEIISSISKEILRKYLNSLSVSGFSGVSSGQMANMQTADTALIISRTV